MKALSILLLLGLPVAYSHSIDRCSVVRVVRVAGAGANTANIVCLAAHASNYSTSLNRSPSEFGIYQISSYMWCHDNQTPGSKDGCGIPCANLLNGDIIDDTHCVLKIIKDPKGFGAWDPWKQNCEGKDLSSYTAGC